jgi:hypothetical protein
VGDLLTQCVDNTVNIVRYTPHLDILLGHIQYRVGGLCVPIPWLADATGIDDETVVDSHSVLDMRVPDDESILQMGPHLPEVPRHNVGALFLRS